MRIFSILFCCAKLATKGEFMKKLLFLSLLLFISLNIKAQRAETLILDKGVKMHKEIDEIYRKFTVAYKNLDVDLVANLYAENANYLASGNLILDGRAKIRENFAEFFENVKKEL